MQKTECTDVTVETSSKAVRDSRKLQWNNRDRATTLYTNCLQLSISSLLSRAFGLGGVAEAAEAFGLEALQFGGYACVLRFPGWHGRRWGCPALRECSWRVPLGANWRCRAWSAATIHIAEVRPSCRSMLWSQRSVVFTQDHDEEFTGRRGATIA